jgi:hypothetical protein
MILQTRKIEGQTDVGVLRTEGKMLHPRLRSSATGENVLYAAYCGNAILRRRTRKRGSERSGSKSVCDLM